VFELTTKRNESPLPGSLVEVPDQGLYTHFFLRACFLQVAGELEDARWFTREQVLEMLAREAGSEAAF